MIGKLRSYHSQLPKELDYYYVWLPDCGHSIMCVLSQHIDDARKGEITDYMLPIPVKYVLEKGYICKLSLYILSNTVGIFKFLQNCLYTSLE